MAKLSLDRALYLPTFSHLLIVNKLLSQSPARSLCQSRLCILFLLADNRPFWFNRATNEKTGPEWFSSGRDGEAPSAAASCWAHDGGRQRGTACPFSTDTASYTHTARSLAALYSPFRQRAHSPTAISGPMARPPSSPPCPPPSHMHAGWIVSATTTLTS